MKDKVEAFEGLAPGTVAAIRKHSFKHPWLTGISLILVVLLIYAAVVWIYRVVGKEDVVQVATRGTPSGYGIPPASLKRRSKKGFILTGQAIRVTKRGGFGLVRAGRGGL